MAETFLILGASSFYGRNFRRYVEDRGDYAVPITRSQFDIDGPLWPLGLAIDNTAPDYIVNFISRSLVAESWGDPAKWMHTNALGMTKLLELLRERKVKYIHASTPESYGHTEDWVDETYSAWKPSTPYAVSRAAGDMMIMAYHRAYGLPAIITRTANIYGEGQGENRIVPLAFRTLAAGKRLDLHGGGETVRSFIHVRDACAATYLIAKRGTSGETYHISTTEAVSISYVVDMIREQVGANGRLIGSQPDRLGKDMAYLLRSNKVRALGWRDEIPLKEGIKNYGQRNRPPRAIPEIQA